MDPHTVSNMLAYQVLREMMNGGDAEGLTSPSPTHTSDPEETWPSPTLTSDPEETWGNENRFVKARTIAYTVLFRWKFFIWRKKRRAIISAIIVAFRKPFCHEIAYSIAHFAFLGGMNTLYQWPGGKQEQWDGETLEPASARLQRLWAATLERMESASPLIYFD